MKTFIIKQLQERAIIRGKQRPWISSCSGEQLYQVFLRLRNGESARSIAQFIQQNWKIKEKSDVHSLSQGILKFKKRIEDLLDLGMGERTDQGLDEASPIESEHLDDLMGLERLVRLQRARIARLLKEEQEKGLRHPSLSKDLQSLAALSKILTREREFTLKHPEYDALTIRQDEMRSQRIKANFDTFMANTSDESRERLLLAMDKFLELAAKHSITMIPERDQNGKIRYKPLE